MTIPAFLFALLIALLYGAIYHFLRGGGLGRLLLYLILSILGFVAGHLVGLWRGWIFFPLGSLNLGVSSIGSVVMLLIGDWLSRIESNPESKV
ncbi:MAG: hypothetical protein C3F07_14445 [Anaerolineales bacterium]|nr:MAG: hypothetical protein C3F07_14445 [Anaerolineales bacterium]